MSCWLWRRRFSVRMVASIVCQHDADGLRELLEKVQMRVCERPPARRVRSPPSSRPRRARAARPRLRDARAPSERSGSGCISAGCARAGCAVSPSRTGRRGPGRWRWSRAGRDCSRRRRGGAGWRLTLGHLINRALLRIDERREFAEQHLAHVKRSRWPWCMRVNFARFVFSQSCSSLRSVVTAEVVDHRC